MNDVAAAYLAGATVTEVCLRFRVSKTTVSKRLAEVGATTRSRSDALKASSRVQRKSEEHKKAVVKAARSREKRENKIAAQARFRAAHREEIRRWCKENRATVSAQKRAWRKNNPQKFKAEKARRRALEKSAVGVVTEAQWATVLAQHEHRCAYCREEKPLTQDHVVPLSRGGAHTIDNLVPACLSCNTSKRNKTPDEWRPATISEIAP